MTVEIVSSVFTTVHYVSLHEPATPPIIKYSIRRPLLSSSWILCVQQGQLCDVAARGRGGGGGGVN